MCLSSILLIIFISLLRVIKFSNSILVAKPLLLLSSIEENKFLSVLLFANSNFTLVLLDI